MTETHSSPDAPRPQRPSDDEAAAEGQPAATTLTVPVAGMTCAGCADNVHTALSHLDGVSGAEVDLAGGQAHVHGDGDVLTTAEVRAAVERLGYRCSPPDDEESASRRRPLLVVGGLVALLLAGVVAFQVVVDAVQTAELLGGLTVDFFATASLATMGFALLLGVIVAFAPSTLAMAPAVMGYIAAARAGSLGRAALWSVLFLAGMLAANMGVGAMLGLGGQAAIRTVTTNLPLWFTLVAVVLVPMGLVLLGVWRPRLPRVTPRLSRLGGAAGPRGRFRGPGGAVLLGVPFGFMACPSCTPLLFPVALGAAATGDPVYGATLMGVFALGRGVPLVVLGTFTGALQAGGALARWATAAQRIIGVLLLAAAAWFGYSALVYTGVL